VKFNSLKIGDIVRCVGTNHCVHKIKSVSEGPYGIFFIDQNNQPIICAVSNETDEINGRYASKLEILFYAS
jgi:hypothetical protein